MINQNLSSPSSQSAYPAYSKEPIFLFIRFVLSMHRGNGKHKGKLNHVNGLYHGASAKKLWVKCHSQERKIMAWPRFEPTTSWLEVKCLWPLGHNSLHTVIKLLPLSCFYVAKLLTLNIFDEDDHDDITVP